MADRRVRGIAGLEQAINDILNEYAEEVGQITGEAVKDVAKEGVKAIKADANRMFDKKNAPKKGRYSTGWGTTIFEERLGTTVVIHNKKYAGMPHLLEFGHLVRNGKRTFPKSTEPRPHVAPVADKMGEMLEQRIVAKI